MRLESTILFLLFLALFLVLFFFLMILMGWQDSYIYEILGTAVSFSLILLGLLFCFLLMGTKEIDRGVIFMVLLCLLALAIYTFYSPNSGFALLILFTLFFVKEKTMG